MIYPHVIRLRHPWSEERTADGHAIRRRMFNRPTGLDAREQVWLVVAVAEPMVSVTVNGGQLDTSSCQSGGAEPARRMEWDITSRLADHNEIAIEGDPVALAAAVEEGVLIEIRLAPVTDF